MKYKPAVTEPRVACRSLDVELVSLPPAKPPVKSVAIKGTVVINPIRW